MPQARHTRLDCSPGGSVEAAISVTQRMLTNQRREMEADGPIRRQVYAEVPPKVEYSLSPLGRSMEPALAALKEWGDANIGLFAKPGDAPGHDIPAAA